MTNIFQKGKFDSSEVLCQSPNKPFGNTIIGITRKKGRQKVSLFSESLGAKYFFIHFFGFAFSTKLQNK